MPRRTKKPPAKPEMRKDWLRRFEENGESPPQIAKADGYDVRTVRKQLEEARQEREGREARATVLRQALEQHYGDLVSFADRLNTSIIHATLPMGARDDRLWFALREHLPRSPLWKAIDRMERLNGELHDIDGRGHKRIGVMVKEKSPLGFVQKPGTLGLNRDALEAAVGYHLRAPTEELLKIETRELKEGVAEVAYGNFTCAVVPSDMASEIGKLIADMMSGIGQWPEREEMARTLLIRSRVVNEIEEELATIILRRIVPGRCKYCPV